MGLGFTPQHWRIVTSGQGIRQGAAHHAGHD
jgi:hypothetical protein